MNEDQVKGYLEDVINIKLNWMSLLQKSIINKGLQNVKDYFVFHSLSPGYLLIKHQLLVKNLRRQDNHGR